MPKELGSGVGNKRYIYFDEHLDKKKAENAESYVSKTDKCAKN